MSEAFTIAVDTREQRPLRFGTWPAVVVGLKTGDYSIVGFEDRIAIERKSLGDLFTSVGRARARFERELIRLAALDYGAIVIEATLARILAGDRHSHVNPKAAVASLLGWSVRYRLPVFFAGSRALAAATVLKLLTKWHARNAIAQADRRAPHA